MTHRPLPPGISELTQSAVQRPECRTLPNGIRLHLLPAGESEVVRFDLLIKGGRWHQSQPLQALFTNRMLREGTYRYTAAQIAEELDWCGAWLELSSSPEHACITLYSLVRHLPRTLGLLESVVKEPLFAEHELGVIIDNNIHQFMVNCSKVDFVAHRTLVSALYGGTHPCGRVVEEADYRAITPDVLRAFYREHYHSGACTLYLSGGITPEAVSLVERHFGAEPWGRAAAPALTPRYTPVEAPGRRFFVERPGALQSAVRLGMLSMHRAHPDYLKARVMLTLFGGYFGSRLMSNIREQKGYTYGISAGIMAYPGHGMLVVSADTDNRYVEPLIAEVYHEIDRLQTDLAPEEELALVRNYMAGEMCRSYESPFSLSDAWIFVSLSGVSPHYFEHAAEAVQSITASEIRELARRYLDKERLKEAVAGGKV